MSMKPDKRLARLRDQVRATAENRPGVYRMLGPAGDPIYVGKSIRVRGRLLSYFRADRGEKAAEIIAYAHRIEWDYVPSEFAAVLREFRLIRRWRPAFNVEHKRKRAVCFVKVPRETAPRLLVTGQLQDDGAAYLGPLQGIDRVRRAVRDLANLLELRDCPAKTPLRLADQADLFDASYPALCVRAELRRCLAPCAAGCTESEYRDRLRVALAFLDGEDEAPLVVLRRRLAQAVDRLQFEYAAELEERATRLIGVRNELARVRAAMAALSCVYPVPGHDGEERWYVLNGGRVQDELEAPRSASARRLALRRVRRQLQRPPSLTRAGADAIAEMLLVMRWFRRRPEEQARLMVVDGTAREERRIA
jgi:excinuclease ABC subunit C